MKPKSAALTVENKTSVSSARCSAWNLSQQRLSLSIARHKTSTGSACRWEWNLSQLRSSLSMKPQSTALVAQNGTSVGSAYGWQWNLSQLRSSLTMKPVGNACRWPWHLSWQRLCWPWNLIRQHLSLTMKPQSAELVAKHETSVKPQSPAPNRIRANKWRMCLPQYTGIVFLMTTKFTTCPH
jgi:hypothetical protein